MPAQFPKRRSNGSFRVKVSLAVVAPDPAILASRVSAWLDDWTAANETWDFLGQRRHFFDEFAREPFGVECQSRSLVFFLEGTPAAKWWRDWLAVRLLKEMKGAFGEIKDLEAITDCLNP